MRGILRVSRLAVVASPAATVGMLLIMLLWAISPVIELSTLKRLVDSITPQPSTDTARLLLIYLVWALLIPNNCWNIYYLLFDFVRQLAQCKLAYEVLRKASRLPLPALEDPSNQDLISRASKVDTGEILGLFFSSTFLVIGTIRVLTILGVLASFDPTIFAIVLGVALPSFVVRNIMDRRARKLIREQTEHERWSSATLDLLFGRATAPELESYGCRQWLAGQWLSVRNRLDSEISEMEGRQVSVTNLALIIRAVGEFSALLVIVALIKEDTVPLGTLASAIVALQQLQWIASAIIGEFSRAFENKLIFEDVDKLLSLEDEGPSVIPIERKKAHESMPYVKFLRVTYYYPRTKTPALSDLTFTVRPGERLAIVGKNGSGKTTILRLLLGLDRPTSGSIKLDGESSADYSKVARMRSTTMFQAPTRYEMSVRMNVAISDAKLRHDIQRIEQSLGRANLLDAINRVPGGIEAELGPDLTGGIASQAGSGSDLHLPEHFFETGCW